MRPKTPLARRIASATDVPENVVQWTFENPNPGVFANDCWRWQAHVTPKLIPMMKHEGKSLPVRRVIRAEVTGEPVPPDERLSQGCRGMFCVNPNHTMVKRIALGPWGMREDQASPAGADDDPIEDIVDAVYSRDQPWDAQALAEEFDYPVSRVEEAIAGILDGTY